MNIYLGLRTTAKEILEEVGANNPYCLEIKASISSKMYPILPYREILLIKEEVTAPKPSNMSAHTVHLNMGTKILHFGPLFFDGKKLTKEGKGYVGLSPSYL